MNSFLNKTREVNVNGTETIFDITFHCEKENICILGTVEGNVIMIDTSLENDCTLLTLEKHHKGSAIRKVRLHDQNLLITAAKTIKLYDLNAGKVIRKIENNNCKIYSLLVIDNYLLCFGDDEGNFKVFDYRIDRGEHMSLKECEDYISDLDIDSNGRVVVASSGEGTLSAFNIRAKKLEPPQSELFDAGFQSVRFMESKNKVLVGAEDGAINIFNINEWGNISDRFPIRGQETRGRGGCSVDCLEVLNEDLIVTSSSDNKLRLVNILPNKILHEIAMENMANEALAVSSDNSKIASVDGSKVLFYEICQNSKNSKNLKNPRNDFYSDL